MDQESKKWTRGNKYCIQNIKTVNIAFDLDPHKYNTLQCITRLQTLTMYYKVTNTDMYYKVTNTDIILQGTNTDNVLFCGNLICIPVLKEMLFMVANKKSWHPFLHI
jgi:hypothetical protein